VSFADAGARSRSQASYCARPHRLRTEFKKADRARVTSVSPSVTRWSSSRRRGVSSVQGVGDLTGLYCVDGCSPCLANHHDGVRLFALDLVGNPRQRRRHLVARRCAHELRADSPVWCSEEEHQRVLSVARERFPSPLVDPERELLGFIH
jgi:hypothetical protein